jgi:hypothetical protein
MILWRPGQRRLELPGDPGVPDEAEEHLAALRPRDGAVANALTRTFSARRALLNRLSERRHQ